nr:MAG TPA: hypothetical protein [Caudoviricetes sp.]
MACYPPKKQVITPIPYFFEFSAFFIDSLWLF